MSEQDISTQLDDFVQNPEASVKFPSRTVMLASSRRSTQQLDGGSLLCKKKGLIIQKFDDLLKKLGGEELSVNISMGRVSKQWEEALKVG